MERLLRLITLCAALTGGLPLLPWLSRPLQLLLATAFCVNGAAIVRPFPAPPDRLLTLAGLVATAYELLQLRLDYVAEPMAALIALFLGLRLISEQNGRHRRQTFLLSLLALAASSLFTLDSAFLFALVATVLLTAAGLVLTCADDETHGTVPPPAARKNLVSAAFYLPLLALPALPLFFFVLPRTQIPLWEMLNPVENAVSGISDRVEPGSVAALAASRRVVFRAEGAELAPEDLYWRVTVLNTPEGRAWVRQPPPAGEAVRLRGGSVRDYALYLDATGTRLLPTPDPSSALSGRRSASSNDLLFFSQTPLTRRDAVRVDARPGAVIELTRPLDPAFYLTLPEEISPRLAAVAAAIRAEHAEGGARLAAVDDFFRQQRLTYSLSTRPTAADPVDAFLFDRRSGYCEDFAVAYVTLLRLSNLPARLVGGYYGGDYSSLGGYYLISEEQAHLWTEILLDNHWQRRDPTLLAVNAGSLDRNRGRLGMRAWIDAFDYYWNRTIIAYDLESQFQLLRRAGQERRDLSGLITRNRIAGLLIVAGIGAGAFLLWRELRRPPLERLLQTFLSLLARDGIGRDDSAGLLTLAERHPHPAARLFAERFNALVFSGRPPTPDDLAGLRRLLRQLNKKS